MAQVEESIDVRSGCDEAFTFLANFENDQRWRKGVARIRQEPGGTAVAGAEVLETFRLATRTIRTRYEVEAVEPGRMVRLRSTSAPRTVRAWRSLEPRDDGCRITVGFDVRAAALGRLAEPMLARLLGRQLRESMGELRRVLER